MRWLLVFLLILSLCAEGGAISYSEVQIKRTCCCGGDVPVCPPVRSCSSVTVIPRVIQERTFSQAGVKVDLRRQAVVPATAFHFLDSIRERIFSSAIFLSPKEHFSASVSVHDYFCVWLT
ncbi:MAG: hypothetical protein V4507_08925 [Verrucomicrobiota bacterium]